MRLKKIRLAGFKSFVDPITIRLPGALTAVVGPNGCGKSNIIDAVRWVMGEISAKHLRGDTMADVVFTGSNTRKPVGQASVELVFDNGDGRLEGRFAAYNEVAVKRQVTRDSQSVYFLNSTRCRRRDVTDVFFGTGLGPRSYAIIEQGMISRLIEARPEELRDFLEEAAGISKYKERRRETENRIRHTRENLERLEDLREELAKRLQHLKRQATMAEKYKVLKQEERELRAELLALRWLALDAESRAKNDAVEAQETAAQAALAEQRRLEAELERARTTQSDATEAFNEVYRRVLDAEAAIARGEEAIQSLRRQREELNEGLSREESRLASAREHAHSEERRLERLRAELTEREPAIERLQQAAGDARLAFRESEEAVHAWQADWEEWSEQAAKPARARDAEAARIQHLEQALEGLESRERRLAEERDALEAGDEASRVADMARRLEDEERALDARETAVAGMREEVARLREAERGVGTSLHATRDRLQAVRGRLASLQAIQQQALGRALGEGRGSASAWLERAGLAGEPRLAEAIRAAPGWEGALETVLGFHLEAVCVDGLDAHAGSLASLEEGALTLFEKGGDAQAGEPGTLAEKVSAPWPLGSLLAGVRTADSLTEALALRPRLAAGESVVTRGGIWLGRDWVRVARAADERAGVLAREQEIQSLAEEFAQLEAELERREREYERVQERHTELETGLASAQAELAEAHRRSAAAKAALGAAQAEQEQSRRRSATLGTELADIASQLAAEREVLAQARRRWRESTEEVDRLDVEREQWVRRRDELRRRLEESRDRWQEVRDEAYDLGLEVQSLRSQVQSLEESRGRNREQVAQLESRLEEMRASLEANDAPLAEARARLEEKLEARSRIEETLKAARERVETAQTRVRELDGERQKKEEAVGAERSTLERLRLEAHEASVRRATIEEQFGAGRDELTALVERLPDDAEVADWEERLEALERRINRLGPINLAAIDEHEQLAERKRYLDAQHEDLSEALETLTAAIAKMDRETRARFKDTYEKVNAGLGQMFPRLFGGGHAYLELTGDDLLSTGVSVMARPPGKRNTSIHLLSGGEKALAAIALVFAIFELNPAPFCLLDEVDAPLDDVNVVRFCELVKDMSERIQFVIVTHNKITMEIAHQLIGVTMNEPGVSRLVAVDVDEAVEMVAE